MSLDSIEQERESYLNKSLTLLNLNKSLDLTEQEGESYLNKSLDFSEWDGESWGFMPRKLRTISLVSSLKLSGVYEDSGGVLAAIAFYKNNQTILIITTYYSTDS